jgi:hypothetical protein
LDRADGRAARAIAGGGLAGFTIGLASVTGRSAIAVLPFGASRVALVPEPASTAALIAAGLSSLGRALATVAHGVALGLGAGLVGAAVWAAVMAVVRQET